MPYIGELRIFAGSFAPAGWMICAGQTLPISENDALFTLIGTTYGGDGQETFNLPNLSGRIPVHNGQGAGLQSYQIGESGGVESVTLTTQQIPSHNHAWLASTGGGTSNTPQDFITATPPAVKLYRFTTPDAALPGTTVQPNGGSQPHENLMPYVCINYIISLYGVFPTQN